MMMPKYSYWWRTKVLKAACRLTGADSGLLFLPKYSGALLSSVRGVSTETFNHRLIETAFTQGFQP